MSLPSLPRQLLETSILKYRWGKPPVCYEPWWSYCLRDVLDRELTVSSDHPNIVQVVSLLLCKSMSALSSNIESNMHGRSRNVCEVGMNAMLLRLVESFWRIIDAQIQVMDARMHSMKWSRSSEYLHQLSLVVKEVANIRLYNTSKKTGEYESCAKIRSGLCEKLGLLHTVRDHSVPGLRLDQSSMMVSDLGDANLFHTQESSSGSKKRMRGTDIALDDDDDFDLASKVKRDNNGNSFLGCMQPDEFAFDNDIDKESISFGVGSMKNDVIQLGCP